MVRLTFLSFQMNDYDRVQIRDAIHNWTPYHSILRSGYLPTFTVYSTGRQLEILVSGNRGKTGPGFFATYTMVPAAGEQAQDVSHIADVVCDANRAAIDHFTVV